MSIMNFPQPVNTPIAPQPDIDVCGIKPSEKSRQCPVCHVYYKYGNSYWQHVRYVHASFLSQCVICEKSYKRTTMAKHHILHSHKIAWHLSGNYIRRIKKSDQPENQESCNGKEVKGSNNIINTNNSNNNNKSSSNNSNNNNNIIMSNIKNNNSSNLKYFKKKTLHLISCFNCYNCPGSFVTINELFEHVKSHKESNSFYSDSDDNDDNDNNNNTNNDMDDANVNNNENDVDINVNNNDNDNKYSDTNVMDHDDEDDDDNDNGNDEDYNVNALDINTVKKIIGIIDSDVTMEAFDGLGSDN